MARVSREDWSAAALRALATDGLKSVAVEPLARELGVTKGSFYWHFKNRDELLQAALEHWEHIGTAAVFEAVEKHETLEDRVRQLLHNALLDRPGMLITHLSAAADHPIVGPVLERVTEQRLDRLQRLYVEAGQSISLARQSALLAYAAYLGLYQIRVAAPKRGLQEAEREAWVSTLLETLLPGARRAESPEASSSR